MNIVNKLTLKTLRKNKVRTLVTIIGIILSAAMLTAVTTGVSTLQNFLINMEIEGSGDWYGAGFDISLEKLMEVENNSQVSQISSLQNIGYTPLADSKNEYKPYIFIGGMDEVFTKEMPVYVLEGRLPENSSEIIIPDHLKSNAGVEYFINDTISMQIGQRVSGDYVLDQNTPFLHEDDGEKEELAIKEERTYKVVGFYERSSIENFQAPGYTALTMADESDKYSYDAYIKLHNSKDIYTFMDTTFPDEGSRINHNLMRYTGNSNQEAFNSVLYSLSAVLMGIIMFGSISLIYNAFSISVSERTKQFGLLSSIGATRRQMSRSVLFEAFLLSIIGVPLGILAGVFGMGVTFKFVQGIFSTLFQGRIRTELILFASYEAIVIAAIVGIATVLISAYIPARRAFKVSAIDAIRLSQDINVKPKKLKTSKLSYKLFGVEGMIAKKNFKRSKKKYRATVVSLFLSIVLFISASSFSAYLSKATTTLIDDVNYDIIYPYNPSISEKASMEDVYNVLKNIDGVTGSSYSFRYYPYFSEIATTNIGQEYKDYLSNKGNTDTSDQSEHQNFSIEYFFIDDEAYQSYLEANSLDGEIIFNNEELPAIINDYARIYNPNDGRYYTFEQLDRSKKTIDVTYVDRVEGYYLSKVDKDENQEIYYEFTNDNNNIIRIPEEQAEMNLSIPVSAFSTELPMGKDINNGQQITLIYPFSAIENVLGDKYSETSVSMYFTAQKHKVTYEKMYEALERMGEPTTQLFDYAEMSDSDKAIRTIINIFSYGFIVLISLIAAANVFNTISTNIGLRRREFAMLKSIGMTQKMFNGMMNYECLLYGIKALAYGIPVSILVTYLIYNGILGGLEIKFFIPWYSIVIAVGSVFAVVFATMIYAMQKIKKDNPIDALKDENL